MHEVVKRNHGRMKRLGRVFMDVQDQSKGRLSGWISAVLSQLKLGLNVRYVVHSLIRYYQFAILEGIKFVFAMCFFYQSFNYLFHNLVDLKLCLWSFWLKWLLIKKTDMWKLVFQKHTYLKILTWFILSIFSVVVATGFSNIIIGVF